MENVVTRRNRQEPVMPFTRHRLRQRQAGALKFAMRPSPRAISMQPLCRIARIGARWFHVS
jgi:hypothetical protein